jgi:histidinol dehydrogenase
VIERFEAGDPAALRRPGGRDDAALLGAVRGIVDDIRARGWAALVEQAMRIDGAMPQQLSVASFAAEARRALPAAAIAAM